MFNDGLPADVPDPECGETDCSLWVGRVRIVDVDSVNVALIATRNGVYRYAPDATYADTEWVSISASACDPCPTVTDFESLAVASIDPFVIYAGPIVDGSANLGIWRGESTDDGETWEWDEMAFDEVPAEAIWSQYNNGSVVNQFRVRDIEVAGTRAYAAVDGAGVYRMDHPLACDPGEPAEFSASPTSITEGDPVQFQSLCSDCSHVWDFGDGCGPSCSTAQNPSHQYDDPGIFTVTHTVSEGLTSCDPLVKSDLIYVKRTTSDPDAYVPQVITGLGPGGAGYGAHVLAQGYGPANGGSVVPNATDFFAYRNINAGVNVGAGRIVFEGDPTPSASILSGPGPSAALGPQVRAFQPSSLPPYGTPIAKVNFYAYGTLRYGVRVSSADVGSADGSLGHDTADEIVTGPGPGAPFGPHVRGWNYDGAGITPINPKINFFAYSTLRYGVNVAGEDVISEVGDEIVTGPGPGPTFGPSLRVWETNGSCCTAKITEFAYGDIDYGLKVGAGEYNEDPDCTSSCDDNLPAIVTAPGPGGNLTSYPSDVKIWGTPGDALDELDTFAVFDGSKYGAEVAMGEVWLAKLGSEVVVGEGPDPSQPSMVKGLYFDGTDLLEVPGMEYDPYGKLHGATVASVPADEPFTTTLPFSTSPADWMIVNFRNLVEALPDSEYACDFCCGNQCESCGCEGSPPGTGDWNVWGDDCGDDDCQKLTALDEIDELHKALPGPEYEGAAQVLDQIAEIEAVLSHEDGIQDSALLAEVLGVLDEIRALYDPMEFPSTGVTMVAEGFDDPSDLAYSSAASFGNASSCAGALFVRPGSGQAGTVQVLDACTFERAEDREVPTGDGEVLRMHVPPGRQELYVATRRECSGGGCSDYALERLPGSGWSPVDAGYLDLLTNASSSITGQDLFTTSPGEAQLQADAAWVCVDSSGTGTCKSVVGLADFDTASVVTVGVSNRVYVALARAPDGGERLYAAHASGVDAIRTKTSGQPTVQNVLAYPSGFGTPLDMDSGVTDGNNKRIYVVSAGKLAVYTLPVLIGLPPYSPTTTVTLDGNAVGVDLSSDGRFVLVTRHPVGDEEDEAVTVVTTYDSDTLDEVRENATAICESEPCDAPPPVPMVVTVDSDHAFVSEPGTGRLAYLYLDPPRWRFAAMVLMEAIEATREEAFTHRSAKAQMLLDASTVAQQLDLAEGAPSRETRRAYLRAAEERLGWIRRDIDGCFGGEASGDTMTDCYEARAVWNATGGVMSAIAWDVVDPPSDPEREAQEGGSQQ